MGVQQVSLDDRFDLEKSPVLLTGTQALVRLMLMQKARDRAAGLNTAGLVTGYRGSPLGAVDMQMARAKKHLEAADVLFQPGLKRGSGRDRDLGQPAGGIARRGAFRRRFRAVVRQGARRGPFGRRDAACEHGRHLAPWRRSDGDGGRSHR